MRQLLITLFMAGGAMASPITCDVISQDLFEHGLGKTHTCECRVCFDTETHARTEPSSNDTIVPGQHWAYLTMLQHDETLTPQKIKYMSQCQNSGLSGHISSNDILTASSGFWAPNQQTKYCRKIV